MKRLLPAVAALAAAGILVAVFAPGHSGGASALAAGSQQPPTAGDGIQPELGLPATEVVAIGSSPGEHPGEIWAYGRLGSVPVSVNGQSYAGQYALLERTDETGWQVVPLPQGPKGETLAADSGSTTPAEYEAFAGQTTAAGGVVLLSGQNIVIRNPGGEPCLVPEPQPIGTGTSDKEPEQPQAGGCMSAEPGSGTATGVLGPGESLFPSRFSGAVTLPYAAIEDTAGPGDAHTGVLVAPYQDGANPEVSLGVLHYDGESWSREPIDTEGEKLEHFTPLALACGGSSSAPEGSSPQNCWLLASAHLKSSSGEQPSLLLYRRVAKGSSYEWARQTGPGLFTEGSEANVSALAQGAQMLTATTQGVWVDFRSAPGGSSEVRDVSQLVVPAEGGQVNVLGAWCYPTGAGCEQTLGAQLPASYRSFAWAGEGEAGESGGGGNFGTRIITGLAGRAMLELSGGSFTDEAGAGGEPGAAPGGAAFEPPSGSGAQEGWIADGANPDEAADGAGQSQVIKLTTSPAADELGEEAVPFRRPLYALAQPPGTSPGAASAPVVAVGELGQIGRYTPGQGWRAESLYNSAGVVQTPTLRGVAWPQPGRIYAVGDSGEMWLWRAETGLWEPDPSKPLNFIGNLQAIAFAPGNPELGYAVGRQGALLKFGKSWEQVPLPAELKEANFTSIAFAGSEAFATYRTLSGSGLHTTETGGIAVEEVGNGQHWHIDPGAGALLDQLPETSRVMSKVAGLPDGGVVAAGPGKVIERESAAAPDAWRFSSQPLPEAQNISALGAFREANGALRAIVSADLDPFLDPENYIDGGLEETPFKIDVPPPPEPDQSPVFLGPDLLPNSGYLLKETAGGWSDMEHDALPTGGAGFPRDLPVRPDPVLAMLVAPEGSAGVAVGGQTGDLQGLGLNAIARPFNLQYQTAAALRFPAATASTNGASPVTVATGAGNASFVVAGQAACAQPCADFTGEGFGPEAWLTHALASAGQIATGSPGRLRAFLYTGSVGGGEDIFSRVLTHYGGSPPAYGPENGSAAPSTVPGPANTSAYSFVSGGDVEVIVLGFSGGALAEEPAQLKWLEERLEAARGTMPAIVVGDESLGFTLPSSNAASAEQRVQVAADAATISSILVTDGASAYFFDYPGANVHATVSDGTRSIPAYGTGTLGYVRPEQEKVESDSLGSSGFLLAEVNPAQRSQTLTEGDVAPYEVTVKVIPNISQLALDAVDGTFLRRSQVALFEALARRAPGGVAIQEGNGVELAGPDPYDKIPFDCQGANCPYEIPEEYTYTSSNPDIGGFVVHEAAAGGESGALQVKLGANQLPVADEPRNPKGELNPGGRFEENKDGEPVNEKGEAVPREGSGLFCPFNSGTTIVTITTGGLTYSEPVIVQAGSVEYPCGTVPLKNPPVLEAPVSQNFNLPELAPSNNPPSTSPQLQAIAPPPAPVAPAVVHPKPHHARPAPLAPFLPAVAGLALLRPALLPPPPTTPRPSPPTGTSSAQVTEGAVAPEREREQEHAIDMVHNMAAYSHEETRPLPYYLPAVILLLAFSSAGLYDARRRRRPELASNGETPRTGT